MAVFPLFTDLKDKRCVIVGGGPVACRKIEILLRFEAGIVVVAPEIHSSVIALAENHNIQIFRTPYEGHFIDNAFLVVAATSDEGVNENVYIDAIKRNIPVNVVDDPEKCTFIFPSVIKRGALTIGISTSGVYPALSKRIRKITEDIFSEEYTGILDLLADFRLKVRKSSLEQPEREKLLGSVLDEFYKNGVITADALCDILNNIEITES